MLKVFQNMLKYVKIFRNKRLLKDFLLKYIEIYISNVDALSECSPQRSL